MATKPPRVIIIGGGILGVSIAGALKTSSFADLLEVVLIEKHAKPGQETSRFNSGVLHPGIHLEPDTFKARFSREGSVLVKKYCKERGVDIDECGMMIVAAWKDTLHPLQRAKDCIKVYKNGRDQHIAMKFLTPWGIGRLEPNIKGMAAIFIPSVAVINQEQYVLSLFEDARLAETRMHLNTEVIGIELFDNRYSIETNQGHEIADFVINAAGLYADQIARMTGYNKHEIVFYRGEYYEVSGEEESKRVNRLVYPVPIEGHPGKGIHFLKTTDGKLLLGPNARRVPTPDYYEEDKTPEDVFRATLETFCPSLRHADLKWAKAGIRTKLAKNDTSYSEPDFIFALQRSKKPFILHILGYESPGLSAAPAAANYVRDVVINTLFDTLFNKS